MMGLAMNTMQEEIELAIIVLIAVITALFRLLTA